MEKMVLNNVFPKLLLLFIVDVVAVVAAASVIKVQELLIVFVSIVVVATVAADCCCDFSHSVPLPWFVVAPLSFSFSRPDVDVSSVAASVVVEHFC